MSKLNRYPVPRSPLAGERTQSRVVKPVVADPAPTGRIMSSLAGAGGLAGPGGIAGHGGGLAG